MTKAKSRDGLAKRRAELKTLAALPEARIDTADIPEVADWLGAERGLFYRPVNRRTKRARAAR